MKLIMLSIDRSLLDASSQLSRRLKVYAGHVEELHVILSIPHTKNVNEQRGNIYIYAYDTKHKISALKKAYEETRLLVSKEPKEYLVSTQEEFTGLVGFFIKRWHGVTWQAQIHTDIGSPYYGRVFFKNRLRAMLAKRTLSSASCIRAVSERVRNNIQRYCHRVPVAIVPIYAELEFLLTLPEKHSDKHVSILVVSRLTKEKNVELSIRAFHELLKSYPNCSLTIVGGGSLKGKLEKLVDSLDIAEKIIFAGNVDNVENFYEHADIFVLASWYDGYGLAAVEAMAAGCTVIMTDVGIAGDILKDGISGLVVPPGDKKGLQAALTKTVESAELRGRLGREAKRKAASLPVKLEHNSEYHRALNICLQPQEN
jgi:glycosyltransferase involved in cell wall biosynthesis